MKGRRLTDASTTDALEGDLKAALRQARIAEAAHADAVMGLRDSKSIRLQLLKDDLAPLVARNADAADLFDLALIAGIEPRLWIDLITFVVMEPDHRTYRLVEDQQDGRAVLLESTERRDIVAKVKHLMAHRLVQRARMAAATSVINGTVRGYSIGSLILAWLTGLALGALGLLAVAIHLGRIKI